MYCNDGNESRRQKDRRPAFQDTETVGDGECGMEASPHRARHEYEAPNLYCSLFRNK